MKATCARAAAGYLYVAATSTGPSSMTDAHKQLIFDRLLGMQKDMDRIATGLLPIAPNGRNATAADVQAYLAQPRPSVRAA